VPQIEIYEKCKRLNKEFSVIYSEEGILKFGCPIGGLREYNIFCEACSEKCPIVEGIEKRIKKIK